MYTVDTALESLRKYDITELDLSAWESALGLEIPVDAASHKLYSAHHINLFKNVKKHLALGRTIDEIRKIIILPPLAQSRPESRMDSEPQINSTASRRTPAATAPERFMNSTQAPVPSRGLDDSHDTPISLEAVSRMAVADGGEIGMPQPVSASAQQYPTFQQYAQAKQAAMSQPQTAQTQQPQAAATATAVATQSPPLQAPTMQQPITSEPAKATPLEAKNPYTSLPKRAVLRSAKAPSAQNQAGAATVVNLVQRLTQEKDTLYKKLMETEKLNSHLYSANSLFHKKANEMSRQINQLKEDRNEIERFKLLDDKSRLHKQLLEAERTTQRKQEEILQREQTINAMQMEMHQAQKRIQSLSAAFNPSKFRGDWVETGNLLEVAYDNFGINIESERVRLFRISEVPTRLYGSCAIINTTYQYESNALWKREESMSVSHVDDDLLEGELIAEYILDGVPVAKAVYRVSCRRK